MKLGLGLPLLGTLASPGAIRTVAVAAEAAGFDSVWAMDRLLSPVAPRTLSCPGRSDGTLPVAQQTVIDPLVALTIAEHVKIGTDVLVAPWYPPVLLARTLAALDQVSTGRLVVGLGLDWSVDEFEAVGAPMPRRGRRTEEDPRRALRRVGRRHDRHHHHPRTHRPRHRHAGTLVLFGVRNHP